MNSETARALRLEVRPIREVPPLDPGEPPWLIESLWAHQAVGLIGGPPKSCKSWLALEMALSVASGAPCLGRFKALRTGPVLVYAAEDSPAQVRMRLEGLCLARGVDLSTLGVHLVLEPRLRLDDPQDQRRLHDALLERRPRLLVLDPLVRLHRIDENSAAEVSGVLAELRAWQRELAVAIALVHHARKGAGEGGQALRGSSDLHAWGDSNLYLRRNGDGLVLSREHRWARSGEPLHLKLRAEEEEPARLQILPPPEPSDPPPDLAARVLELLRRRGGPVPLEELRDLLRVRTQRVRDLLREMLRQNQVRHTPRGWCLRPPRS